MNIHIQPYPTMDEVLRLFAEKPKKAMFKPPRDLYSRNFRDYLTMDGRQAFGDLSSFVLRLATLAHGGCEGVRGHDGCRGHRQSTRHCARRGNGGLKFAYCAMHGKYAILFTSSADEVFARKGKNK